TARRRRKHWRELPRLGGNAPPLDRLGRLDVADRSLARGTAAARDHGDRDVALTGADFHCDRVADLDVVRGLHTAPVQPHAAAPNRLGRRASRLEEPRAPEPAVDTEPTRVVVVVVGAAHRLNACRRSNTRTRRAGRLAARGTRTATMPTRASAM